MGENTQQKARQFMIKATIVFLFILAISASAIMAFNTVNIYQADTIERIEQEKRNDARMMAEEAVNQFSNDIANGIINIWDDNGIHEWALENLSELRNGSPKSNVVLVNIGYSVNEYSREIISELHDPDIVTNEERYIIHNAAKELVTVGKTNSEIGDELDVLVERLYDELYQKNSETKITYAYLRDLLFSTFFVNEVIIYDGLITDTHRHGSGHKKIVDEISLYQSQEDVQTIMSALRNGKKTEAGDNYTSLSNGGGVRWIEWATYPDSIVGQDSAPNTIYGMPNVNYRKFLIIVTTQADEIIAGYSTSFDTLGNLRIILVVNIAFSIFTALVVIAILFLNIIKDDKYSPFKIKLVYDSMLRYKIRMSMKANGVEHEQRKYVMETLADTQNGISVNDIISGIDRTNRDDAEVNFNFNNHPGQE